MNSPRPSESADLTPRQAVILVGAGGTGAKTLAQVARTLEQSGDKFGGPVGETGAIVHALLIDGDEKSWTPAQDNPDADVLVRCGVKTIHLYDREQSQTIRKRGLADIATPGLVSDADPAGCNADPRSSLIRLLNQLELAGEANPRHVMRQIALSLLDLNEGVVLGETVELIFVGGMHGGTGPVLRQLAAVAKETVSSILSRGSASRVVRSTGYFMSSESADLDQSMSSDAPQAVRRRRNTAVQSMLLDEATVTGGVDLMDGKTRVEGVPFSHLHIVHARSGERATLAHYGPTAVIAGAIDARIYGKNGVASALSNVNLGINEPEEVMTALPNNRIALGISRLKSNPSRELLTVVKKEKALVQATGVDNVDAEEVKRRLAQVGIDEFLDRTLRGLKLPSIDHSDYGALDKVGVNVRRVVGEFRGELPELESALAVKVTEVVRGAWSGVKQLGELRTQGKLGTLLSATEALSIALVERLEALRTSVAGLTREIGAHQAELNSAVSDLEPLKYDGWLPGKKKAQEDAIRSAQSRIETAADRLASATARLAATQALITELTRPNGFQANLESTRVYAAGLKRNVDLVRGNIKPDGVIESPFDLEVAVPTPDFSAAGAGLNPGDYSVQTLTALVDGVQLQGDEADLRPVLRDPLVQNELVKRASPLVLAPSRADHDQKGKFNEITVPVDDTVGAVVALDGTVKNADKSLGIQKSFNVRAAAPGAPITVERRVFGLGALDDDYIRGVTKALIMDVLKSRSEAAAIEQHFPMRGDMQRLMPVYADAIAADEAEKDGYNGETVAQQVPGYDGFVLNVYKTRADLAREARVAAARQPKKV